MTALNGRTERETGGFTLAALVVVLVIIALLTGVVLLPALANVRSKAVQIQCATHLRQLGVAAQIYAEADSRKRFPDCTGAVWPWDLHATAANGLMRSGAKRDMFYCPGYPEQNNDTLWVFTTRSAPTGGFRVIGYSLAFRGAGRVLPTNITESVNPSPYLINGQEYQPGPGQRVLIADATLSIGANEVDRTRNRYTAINGGWVGHRTSHLNGRIPAGGNLTFLDGHTEWRLFDKMRIRTVADPPFWW